VFDIRNLDTGTIGIGNSCDEDGIGCEMGTDMAALRWEADGDKRAKFKFIQFATDHSIA
jgi:hypothetical protein